ncbi:double-strand break repair protein AddB [Sphingomonas sp. S1-29]|uniref:double-strand break repair protein AddB n=1 Tax=Sphingomonas sp. S1-29 TaxID=2991074 RepID=UPI00223FD3F3|nr:double-strand break repair protein AddB [Sphingomonas sp. S1-29]UZK69852.1 double-strand break repair protein AddB [Sphingomonas sp. S1-29]
MAERRLGLYTIPPHRAFADTLAIGLIRRFGRDRMGLARGVVLVPNHRAGRAITDAFVRASEGGLLLPRIVAIGDPDLDEAVGPLFDPADAEPVPPAVPPLKRRMILARLLTEARGDSIEPAEAVRLAGELGRTLDQMQVEEVEASALRDLELTAELSDHWQSALSTFEVVLDRWPGELARLGMIDMVVRRRMLLDRTAVSWRDRPPEGFVCVAGVTNSSPPIARLLRVVAGLQRGLVVLPGLATDMEEAQWASLGPHAPDPVTGARIRSIETHPQYHLKLLLDRMGVNRAEVAAWRVASELDATPARGKAIASAMAPAAFTHLWTTLPGGQRRFDGVRALEVATPAEEAQAIALALREVLELPGRTAALVTPDRNLARRVAAHCARWGVAVDDSAGQKLSTLPPGTLLLAIADAIGQRFAPMALLTLLKHPLVAAGEGRLAWLEGARALDLALRGPRPGPGLDGIDAHLREGDKRTARVRETATAWWGEARARLEGIAALDSPPWKGGAGGGSSARDTEALVPPTSAAPGLHPPPTPPFQGEELSSLIAMLREAATTLCGDAVWSRADGRAAAQLLADLEIEGADGPRHVAPGDLLPLLRTLFEEISVRPPQGGHPRLAIYGLIEAQLQTADLMVLGGLNEGVWPALPAPDPWLAPRIRSELGLPSLERRIGLAAHDFAMALGAPEVLLTRARRDSSSPTIASRFWLRMEALSAGLEAPEGLADWARALDRPDAYAPATRPAPNPPVEARPRKISVTEVDRLKADPYAFYARRMLGLMPLDPVDADPTPAWRGTAVHAVLQAWSEQDQCRPDALKPRALAMLGDARTHPVLRALWQPRLIEAIDWIAGELTRQRDEGRAVIDVEQAGKLQIAGVTLSGKYDRIDRMPDGTLGIVDYKTGTPPSNKAVSAGYSLQLGLIGLIAERGGFERVDGIARTFEYWSLGRNAGKFGFIRSPVAPEGKGGKIDPDDFIATAQAHFADAVGRWLTGDEPFIAKLEPEFAPYAEYDQLMRRDEWYGRE